MMYTYYRLFLSFINFDIAKSYRHNVQLHIHEGIYYPPPLKFSLIDLNQFQRQFWKALINSVRAFSVAENPKASFSQ